MHDFRDVVLNQLRVNYYDTDNSSRPFSSRDKAVLQILIRAHAKIRKHKKLSDDEIVAILNEEECDWTNYERSHEKLINYLYIQGGIKNDLLYKRLMDIEKERLHMSLEMKKIVQFSIA